MLNQKISEGNLVLFNSLHFMIFFPTVVLLYFLIPAKVRYIWLLLMSYIFCVDWNFQFTLVLLYSTVISYLFGLILEKLRSIQKKNGEKDIRLYVCLWCGIMLCLLPLVIYKYADFFGRIFRNSSYYTDNFSLLVPVGISFYILQVIGYMVDVYRKDIRAEHHFLKYALFISFFPKFMSGPIETADNFLRQISDVKRTCFDYMRVKNGLLLMMYGYFQKIVLADNLAVFVGSIYDHWEAYSGTVIIVGTVAFAFQLYADFAGYTNIALGASKILGYNLCQNFKQPYLALSIKDFWKRWHISLSSWLQKYIYIPLGGNRKGQWHKYVNIIITFMVSGLWHGASWSFVAWGILHGIYQIVGENYQFVRDKLFKKLNVNRTNIIYRIGQRVIVFVLVDIAWLFFRASGLKTALLMLKKCLLDITLNDFVDGTFYRLGLSGAEVWIIIVATLVVIFIDLLHECNIQIRLWLNERTIVFRWLCYLCMFIILAIAAMRQFGTTASNFIYAQF